MAVVVVIVAVAVVYIYQPLGSEFNKFWIQSFPSPRLVAEEPSLPYYLPIAFPSVLFQCEMQSVSSRIWTRVAVSISYDDNHYTTGTSRCCCGFRFVKTRHFLNF